jgi:hypothetical protein
MYSLGLTARGMKAAACAGIADWASLPEPVQRAHSEYYLAKTVEGKAAARVAIRAAPFNAESGSATSRTRPRDAEASPAREQGPRGLDNLDRKVNRVPVDHGTAMVTDGLDELGDDDVDRQGQPLTAGSGAYAQRHCDDML